jgi:PAS domain S-box-containing protein
MRFLFKWIIVFVGLLDVNAQNFPVNRQIRGVELPSDIVYNVQQDAQGQMWFNTALGVFYSDGFFTYPIPDSIQNQLSRKVEILSGRDGAIWVYNKLGSPKVFRYKDSDWTTLQLPDELKGQSINYLRFDLFYQSGIEGYFFITRDYLYFFDGTSWNKIPESYEKNGALFSVFGGEEETLLLFEKRALKFDGNDFFDIKWSGIDLPGAIARILVDKENANYYFLGENFFAVGPSADKVDKMISQGFIKSAYGTESFSGLILSQGNVIYHYNSQLFKYSPVSDDVIELSSVSLLRTHNIYGTFVDREGNLWVTSHRGLLNISSFRFLTFTSPFLLEDEVTALLPLTDNKILVGLNHGLQILENGKPTTIYKHDEFVGQPEIRITNFSMDGNGTIWFTANALGLGIFDPLTRTVAFRKSPFDKYVHSVHVVGDSLFVLCENRVYLSSIHNSSDRHFEKEISAELINAFGQTRVFIRKVGKLSDGRLIFMQGGAGMSKQEQVLSFQEGMAVIGYDFLEWNDRLLFATETGLKILKGDNLLDFEWHGQKIQRPVYALLEDSTGRVWAGTDRGVYLIEEQGVRQFNEKSGLVGSEINRGALKEGFNGNIWIGTSKGLSKFNPREDSPSVSLPPVSLGSIQIEGIPDDELNIKRISFSNNNINIPYQAVTFLQDAQFVIKYKLEGFHDSWVEITNPRDNELFFSNLPAGDYRLLFRASSDGVNFTDFVSSAPFKILKPVYLQSWFLTLITLFLLGVGYLIKSLLTQTKQTGALKLEVDEKTKEFLQSEYQFKNVWESSKDGLMLSLLNGKVIAANEALSKLSGVEFEKINSGYIWDLFSEQDFYQKEKQRLEEKYSEKVDDSINLELKFPFVSGEKIIDYYSSLMKSEHADQKVYLSVFRDITDKKVYEEGLKVAKEKAEQASRIKSAFLSNMSHEIRTPLNGILGTTENILLNRQNDPELNRQLEIIQESGERLLNTINSILDLSKIEANKMDIRLETVNLNEYLSKLLLPLKAIAVKRGLLITVRYSTQPFIAKIDTRYFEMIVNNIIGNAIKYSEKGLISVTLSKYEESLQLEVLYQGVGMSKAFIVRVFNSFEQESQGYGRTFEGTGLGLTITKNLVDLMKGKITIESEKNIGTRVLIILPVGDK